MFLKLISVDGVGPKMGVTILTGLTSEDLVEAIFAGDVKRLSTVKGLGKKAAEKIILALHGKLSALEILGADEPNKKQVETGTKLSPVDEEAVTALMGLGFTRTESTQAVKRAREAGATDLEEIIRKALASGF